MLTIGRRRPRSSPRGDVQSGCAYCGVQWYRSQLRRDRSGNLSGPDCRDYEGHDIVTLSEGNAAYALSIDPYTGHWNVENYDNDGGLANPVPVKVRLTADDI